MSEEKDHPITYLDQDKRKMINILKAPYTFLIITKIYNGYRPSHIAKQLGISAQLVKYYTDNLIDLKLIEKVGDRRGIEWKVSTLGSFILQQKISRSVNYYLSSNSNNTNNMIPIRMHNLTFSFDIMSGMDNDDDNNNDDHNILKLPWKSINNGVRKCFFKYQTHTLEITKSPNEGESVLEVHLREDYVLDPFKGLLRQYDSARHYASQAAQRLRLQISDNGSLTKRPHMAFEHDVIALYLATFQTAEITTTTTTTTKGEGKAWFDASKGNGEIETNDANYAYKYLTMPQNIVDISETIKRMDRKLDAGHHHYYAMYYHPTLTDNN
jgi:hypothetical protein